MSTENLLVLCTCPDKDVAEKLATAVVEAGVAACANLLPGITSIYKWEGEVKRDEEVLLLIKTTEARFEGLKPLILALHPYELPEIIGVLISHGHDEYLDWIQQVTDS